MNERKETIPIIVNKAKDIILSPITFARDLHQLALVGDRIGRESWGVKKTIACELAIMTPPHLFLLSLATNMEKPENIFLLLLSSIVTLAVPAGMLVSRVYDPEAFRELLKLDPKSPQEIWRRQLHEAG